MLISQWLWRTDEPVMATLLARPLGRPAGRSYALCAASAGMLGISGLALILMAGGSVQRLAELLHRPASLWLILLCLSVATALTTVRARRSAAHKVAQTPSPSRYPAPRDQAAVREVIGDLAREQLALVRELRPIEDERLQAQLDRIDRIAERLLALSHRC
jgi:hypothetical protein